MDYKEILATKIAGLVNMDLNELKEYIEIPPNPELGDYAFPCFRLAKELKKAPPMIAAEIKEKMELDNVIDRVDVVGGYLNFYINKEGLVRSTLEDIYKKGEAYGSSEIGNGKTIVIDYSAPNIAKPFHIGHLSTTVIGNALSRIYKHLGYNTVSINHLGDWGTQFGKLIVAYKLWGDEAAVNEKSVMELLRLYVKYHEEAEQHPEMDDEARAWFKKIEDGDGEALSLFNWFKELTLASANKVYDMLGVKFDSYAGESFYTPFMPATVDELRKKNLLTVDDGASIVDLSEYNMPPCLILKSDGATLYATRDITTAIYRKNTYDFCKLLYVVAYQQDLHFKQFFKVLELMGYDWVKDCEHVNYGMVSLEDGAMSTRKGKYILLEDVLNAAISKAKEIITEKNPSLEKKDEVARQVGVGAVVWSPLYNNRIKDIVFSLDKVLNFEGETAPYAQYTHARCCSLLKKAGVFGKEAELLDALDTEPITSSNAVELIKSISALPDSIKQAADKNEPYIIARRVTDICGKFNKFYTESRIIGESENVMRSRLALVAATAKAVSVGLYLLGVEAPEQM
ncbi:MAG: arginine--tRNA ligase [Clostridia bacterium]|nr:arginine--tRNA ligase [Clostridia bacterium]